MDSDFLKPLVQKDFCEMMHDSQRLHISIFKTTQTSPKHAVKTSQYTSILSSIRLYVLALKKNEAVVCQQAEVV